MELHTTACQFNSTTISAHIVRNIAVMSHVRSFVRDVTGRISTSHTACLVRSIILVNAAVIECSEMKYRTAVLLMVATVTYI